MAVAGAVVADPNAEVADEVDVATIFFKIIDRFLAGLVIPGLYLFTNLNAFNIVEFLNSMNCSIQAHFGIVPRQFWAISCPCSNFENGIELTTEDKRSNY